MLANPYQTLASLLGVDQSELTKSITNSPDRLGDESLLNAATDAYRAAVVTCDGRMKAALAEATKSLRPGLQRAYTRAFNGADISCMAIF